MREKNLCVLNGRRILSVSKKDSVVSKLSYSEDVMYTLLLVELPHRSVSEKGSFANRVTIVKYRYPINTNH